MEHTIELSVDGDVATPRIFDGAALAALPDQVDDIAPLVPGRQGGGVRLSSLLAAVGARGGYVTLVAADGFSICVPRGPVETGVVTFRLGAGALPEQRGGPVRFFVVGAVDCKTDAVDGVDACANVKRLAAIRVSAERAEDTHQH